MTGKETKLVFGLFHVETVCRIVGLEQRSRLNVLPLPEHRCQPIILYVVNIQKIIIGLLLFICIPFCWFTSSCILPKNPTLATNHFRVCWTSLLCGADDWWRVQQLLSSTASAQDVATNLSACVSRPKICCYSVAMELTRNRECLPLLCYLCNSRNNQV
jgi:hypothetical protein